MVGILQAGFSCDYVIAYGFPDRNMDCFHDIWRDGLAGLAKPADRIAFVKDISTGDPIVLEEVFKGDDSALRLADAWLDPTVRDKNHRKVQFIV